MAVNEREYGILLTPIEVGHVTIPNRIAVTSHTYGFANASGVPTEEMDQYVLARARGGCGLLILGETLASPLPEHDSERWGASLSSDSLILFYNRLVTAVNPWGTVLLEQLFHPGGQVWPENGAQSIAPSRVAHSISSVVPAEMSQKIISRMIADFGRAAERAKEGGLAGVEVKADQGKLHHQFLSPHFNRRTDRYGGSTDARERFLMETLEEIRTRCGSDFVIGVRLAADTLRAKYTTPQDITLEESLHLVRSLSDCGMIDYISVTGGTNSSYTGYWQGHGDESMPRANFASLGAAVKENTDLPVLLTSMILHPQDALRVVEEGSADIVGMTRAHIADPDIVLKIREGRVADIRPCISCNQGCVGSTWDGGRVGCIHNAATGRELSLTHRVMRRKPPYRRVAIVGGGPAGLEAARVAGGRGHSVVLFEASQELGGQVLLAAKAPFRNRFAEIASYLRSQVEQLSNVDIRLGEEVTTDSLARVSCEALVLATGSRPVLPDIPNISTARAFTVEQAFVPGTFSKDDRILVVDEDWTLNALSVALYLRMAGANVSLLTSNQFSGKGLDIVTLTAFQSRLRRLGVSVQTWSELVRFEDGQPVIMDLMTESETSVQNVDAVFFAVNRRPDESLASAVGSMPIPTYRVGDCIFPRGIQYAVLDGHQVGASL